MWAVGRQGQDLDRGGDQGEYPGGITEPRRVDDT